MEQAAEEVCIEASKPPLIFQLPPERAREVLNTAQDTPVFKYPATIKTIRVNTGKWGVVTIHFIKPDNIMLNALDQTNAVRAAMDASTEWINRKNTM